MVQVVRDPPGGVGGGGGSFNPPTTKTGSSASSPGLLTSTGGLVGASSLLVAPCISALSGATLVTIFDPTNFDTEESAEYDFPQETMYGEFNGECKFASINKVKVKYRELGIASCSINITVYLPKIDDFKTVQMPLKIPHIKLSKARQQTFPDGKLHTVTLHPVPGVITGERPQVTITRNAKSGPLSITRVILYGDADNTDEE